MPLLVTFMPVRPSPSQPWPPPVCVSSHRGLGQKGFSARECCSTNLPRGWWPGSNKRVRPRLDLHAINNLDSRRLEVVVDGLSLFRGAQLAIDTTLVSPLSQNGTARPRCATVRGAALDPARTRKERRYPELARARLVVLAGEIGGRFSSETAQFLRCLASDRVRSRPLILKGRIHAALIRRWSAVLGCSAARSYALLDKVPTGVDGSSPSVNEVLRDDRHVGQLLVTVCCCELCFQHFFSVFCHEKKKRPPHQNGF